MNVHRRSIRRVFGTLVLTLLGMVATYLLAAVLGALIPGATVAAANDGDRQRTIILMEGPIHYDILLPLDDATREAFDFANHDGVLVSHPEAEWLSIGWGSRAFYTNIGGYSDLTIPIIWRAATGDQSVIRLDSLGSLPAEYPALRYIKVTETQLTNLRDLLVSELGPEPVVLKQSGFGPNDRFYTASDTFSLARTCNVWVSDTLRQAGIAMGIWTPTPYAVTLSLRVNRHIN